MREVEPATPTSDRVCGHVLHARAMCDLDQYFNTMMGACVNLTMCGAGQMQGVPPTATSDRTCADCMLGMTFKSQPGENTTCINTTQCAPGLMQLVNATLTTDRLCAPCPYDTYKNTTGEDACMPVSPICSAGSYQVENWTPTSDRVCAACNVSDGMYQDLPDQDSCKTLTDCGPGSYTSLLPTASSDRHCAPCSTGTYQNATNQPSCLNDTVCTSDKTYASTPTPTADPTCICILGRTYQSLPVYNPALPCQPVTQCSGAPYFDATLTTDNICAIVTLFFIQDYSLYITNGSQSASFAAALSSRISQLPGIDATSFVQVVLAPGSRVATVQLANESAPLPIIEAANAGDLTFTWQGTSFAASTDARGCPAGYVFVSNTTCQPCPADYFVCAIVRSALHASRARRS